MNFKKANNIVGWVVCLIACTTYILTAELSGSYWDCGEFVSSCFKVQIPHPPGAPFFVLIGRFFIILFGNNPLEAAKAVNVMSALSSGFAILFLFWTITHFARRIVQGARKIEDLNKNEIFMIMLAGTVGALAFTFSDSYWYSAVEGEVYALSAFFTALVFWAMLKWEHKADEPGADKWIVFICFMMGLAVGVHLLNLLTIPAMVLIFFFRKRHLFNYKLIKKYFVRIVLIGGVLGFIVALIQANSVASQAGVSMDATVAMAVLFGSFIAVGILYLVERGNKEKRELYGGTYIFFILSIVILGFVQIGVIQESIQQAGNMDIFFVNTLNMPLFSGFITFFVLVAILMWFAFRYAKKKNWHYIRLGLWCLTFMFIGFSSYLTTMIRSTANPSIDMFNVDNPMSLVGYLNRSQYGSFPLLYGQKFTANPIAAYYGEENYQKGVNSKGETKYIPTGKTFSYIYSPDDEMIFPRVWNTGTDRNQTDFYASWLGIGKDPQTGQYERAPNFVDNIKFFLGYQVYYMYLRYFLWNYSGRQNDLQGNSVTDVRDGNWITGIPFIDNLMLGDQSMMPHELQINKGHNVMFALPLILGLIGMFYHFKKKGDDGLIAFLLFFMTGFAIVMYLNQAGNEPRERDYAYAGSTYAFAIWIGIGVFQVKYWLQKITKPRVATIATSAICLLAVPLLMAQQEWNDHDRSKKRLAPDMAIDYLKSCAPNAILFTFGDNDTYPLWYAQEVEGVRPDIRVINTSLLGIDWYINDLRTKVNQSDSIDVIFTKKQIEGDTRNQVMYVPKNYPQSRYYDLYDMLKNYVGSNDPSKMQELRNGASINTFPVRNVYVPVDKAEVLKNGTVNATDSVQDALRFTIDKDNLFKNDLAELAIIAANKWKRPIYFTMNHQTGLGSSFESYLRKDGLSYRLVPVASSDTSSNAQYNEYKARFGALMKENVNTDWMYNKLMNDFVFGNANIPGVYFDEENRRHLITIREAFADEGIELARVGRIEDAKKVLEKCDHMMLQENFPYGMPSKYGMHNQTSFKFLIAAYLAKDQPLIDKVTKSLKTDLVQEVNYYNSLPPVDASNYSYETQSAQQFLMVMNQMEQEQAVKTLPPNLEKADSSLHTMDSGKK
ncbi:protein O-mannosyl-transferase family [Arachidicoccus soli]|uniref:DUF2723 domain-containing protein n=1 Tax=Arachidicoccus soli TaxID=2341117 RepID=A0A386HR51_9BACT|nr:DUF2723 domain-containing protein [Arachidicoccus soli]AYD48036.1 DUF2723 domain-containing protein [Arachidicoccus soli]